MKFWNFSNKSATGEESGISGGLVTAGRHFFNLAVAGELFSASYQNMSLHVFTSKLYETGKLNFIFASNVRWASRMTTTVVFEPEMWTYNRYDLKNKRGRRTNAEVDEGEWMKSRGILATFRFSAQRKELTFPGTQLMPVFGHLNLFFSSYIHILILTFIFIHLQTFPDMLLLIISFV